MINEVERLNRAVDAFAAAMKAKLGEKYLQGYWGWDDPVFIPVIQQKLVEHVERGAGQEVDIANLCMFLWHHQQQVPHDR